MLRAAQTLPDPRRSQQEDQTPSALEGYLQCEKSAREVDLGRISDALTVESGGCSADFLPLDLLIEDW